MEKKMFENEYSFRGTHALKVDKLTAKLGDNISASIFERNIDIYIAAPIIGFLYGRKVEIDKSTPDTAKIMGDRVIKSKEDLKYNYRLIMLLDTKHEQNADERINKAFRYIGSEKSIEDEKLFEDYVRGGIDVLYEKIMESAHTSEDYLKNLYDFLEEFDERYNEAISSNDIADLCRLARS